jgi:hypothetical protein
MSLPASTMQGLGGMAPQRLDGGCVLCCVRREQELSGVVVASMASLVKVFTSV